MSRSLVGQILLNRYRVDEFIQAGGMGAVYKVWDLKRRVPLAMKVLRSDLLDDPHLLKRFQREARTLQRLKHPNIVRFYGLARSGDVVFLLEHYVDGFTLREALRQRKRQGKTASVRETLGVLRAVSAALAYAHEEHGVVHCDIKPDNVMMDRAGNVYLMDFGIARHADSTTTTILGIGTAPYMAPEQIRQEEQVSPATDVYALGVMTFEMLTGRRPFEARGNSTAARLAQMHAAHLKTPPPDPRTFNPQIPPEASKVILRALAKDPAQRYPNAWRFFEALTRAFRFPPEHVPERVPSLIADLDAETAIPAVTPTPPPPLHLADDSPTEIDYGPAAAPPPAQPAANTKRISWPIIMGIVILLLACTATGAAALWWNRQDRAQPAPTATANHVAAATASSSSASQSPFPVPTPTSAAGAIAAATTIPPTYTPWPTYTPLPTFTPIGGANSWVPCEDARPSRLRPGMYAHVTWDPPLPNRVRIAPGLDKRRIGWLQTGERMYIIEGPECASHMVWWKIRSTETGLVGWTSEGDQEHYWLEPDE